MVGTMNTGVRGEHFASTEHSEPHLSTGDMAAPGPARGDYQYNERIRKRESQRSQAERRVAAANFRIARDRSRMEKLGRQLERAREDEDLAKRGLKRSFWTGRIVPVRRSYRARAHTRRL